ncbi:MAG: roadblock/LC7 domain-containing protein [Candidatus Lokiarchaeota archaeon]|nr:roadblock/LC7 domain-containing protein [Candidatus Lokiarchaeota archaeon]
MNIKEKIKIHLDQIKQLKGVENVVLTQRDGNPIQSSGVWFTQNEIFNVCSAASAIYNIGINLYPNNLKYILIEGKKAKILIAPLSTPIHEALNRILTRQGVIEDKHEFFIAITAQPNVNLGGIFLQTNECLKKIKTTLITSGESFKPPLIEFDNKRIKEILNNFSLKDEIEKKHDLSSFSLNISEELSWELNKILNNFSHTIKELNYSFLSLEGGFVLSKKLKRSMLDNINLDHISAMNYSLFETANRCAWLLKKMNAESILLDCRDSFQFIHGINNAIFCSEISKSKQKLGLIRLYIPQFLKKIELIIRRANEEQRLKSFDIKNILGELLIK